MSISLTGSGPSIEMSGSGSSITLTISTGGGSSGGVTDHGDLTGLTGSDDHTQYALADGTRGDFEESGAVSTHNSDTTSVHGIADTSALATTSDLSTTTYNEVADAGSAEELAWAEAPDEIVHDITMTEDCAITFGSASGDNEVNSMTLILRGAYTPTLPASVDWAGGSAPTYGSPSVYEFVTVDNGVTVLGFLAGAAIA